MSKENKCKYFGKRIDQCGFAKWLIDKPMVGIKISGDETCGIKNIKDCPRRQNKIPGSMKRYGPYFEWEYNSSMPDGYVKRD